LSDKIEVYPFRRLKKETKKETAFKRKREKAGSASGKRGRKAKGEQKAEGLPVLSTGSRKKEFENREKAKSFRLFSAIGKQLFLCGAGFFLGKAVLLDELAPFAPAFTAAAAWVFPAQAVPAALAVIAGIVTHGKSVLINTITVLLVLPLLLGLSKDIKKPWLLLPGLVFTVTLVTKAGFLAFSSALPYDYIAVLFEAIFAGTCTLIFSYALPSLRKFDGVQNLNAEELFCVFILCTAVVAGTGSLSVWEITLQGFLSRLIILTAALIGGMGQGAAAGALLGIIPGLAYTGVPVMMGAYSFAGLLAGAGRALGKAGVAMGFLLGNIILSIYLQNFGHLVAVLSETGLAMLFFFAIPAAYTEKISASLAVLSVMPGDNKKIQAAVTGRMRKWSHIFRELAHSYAAAASPSPNYREEPALQSLFNEISNKVCSGCGLFRTCWEREFYRTYQSFLGMFTYVEIYGQVTAEDLPEVLKRRCTRGKELAITITCLYDTYKLNRYWARRFLESKEILSEQLKSVSEVIEDLSQQLPLELEASAQKEIFLKEKLKQAGVPAVEVKIYPQENGKKEIFLKRQPCADQRDCYASLVPVISQLMEEPLALPNQNCTGVKEGLCHLRLYPELKYQVKIGVAKIGKGGSSVSGDSHTFVSLRGGKFAFILSDGMGTGPPAALQSGTTVSLLEHLLESGLNTGLAIKTVNSLMMSRSGGDNFATIDMVMLDLYSGQAEFIKIGAPPGLIARGRRVSQVKAASLPAGIIKDIDVTSVAKSLAKGDLLVIFSDGLLDTYKGPREKEEWAKEVLQDASGLDPQEIADLFLKLAQTNAGGEAHIADDITIIVARIQERRNWEHRKELSG